MCSVIDSSYKLRCDYFLSSDNDPGFMRAAAMRLGVPTRVIVSVLYGYGRFDRAGCFFCSASAAIRIASYPLRGRMVCWSCFYKYCEAFNLIGGKNGA